MRLLFVFRLSACLVRMCRSRCVLAVAVSARLASVSLVSVPKDPRSRENARHATIQVAQHGSDEEVYAIRERGHNDRADESRATTIAGE